MLEFTDQCMLSYDLVTVRFDPDGLTPISSERVTEQVPDDQCCLASET